MDIFCDVKPEEYSVEYAVSNLEQAKENEETYKKLRIRWEELVAAKIPGPDVGQKTVKLEDGTSVIVKRGFNYKCQCDDLYGFMVDTCPQHIPPIKTKTTRELDEKGYNWYANNHPDIFRELSQFVTATPKKVSIEVKRK